VGINTAFKGRGTVIQSQELSCRYRVPIQGSATRNTLPKLGSKVDLRGLLLRVERGGGRKGKEKGEGKERERRKGQDGKGGEERGSPPPHSKFLDPPQLDAYGFPSDLYFFYIHSSTYYNA